MSLSETRTETPASIAEELAELRGLVLALHEELCYMRGQWPRVAEQVGDLHATLSAMQPLIQKYAAAAGSPAARWARGRGRPAGVHQCQGYQHLDPVRFADENVACVRTDSHRWSAELGCHSIGPSCG